MNIIGDILALLRGDLRADLAVVPRSGAAAWLTLATAAAMAFLAVFFLAFANSAGRLANHWSEALSRTSTIRLSAPVAERQAQTQAVLTLLEQTPGIASARALTEAEQITLLEPWFGPDFPVQDLPIPRLIEIVETARGYDAVGLRQRLAAEAPSAVLDDHTRWRRPLVRAAQGLRGLGWASLLLITGAMAAVIALAARAALTSNEQVIRVLRLVGAQDRYIALGFMRRFTVRAAIGAAGGTVLGALAVAFIPDPTGIGTGQFLTTIGFEGPGWASLLFIPGLTVIVAFWATRSMAFRMLGALP